MSAERTRIAKRNESALLARYEKDGVASMTHEQWGEWVNTLPLPEFMAMMSLRGPSEPQSPAAPSRDRIELCKRLAGVAAFNLDEWPGAQKTVYAAIRELQK